MNKIFKYKTNDEVWVIHENEIRKMTIKDSFIHIKTLPDKDKGGKFLIEQMLITYSLYYKFMFDKPEPIISESRIFPTKEALINSL